MLLLPLFESWTGELDQNVQVGAILKYLSKAFDCIPHDLLFVTIAAYRFNLNALALIFTYYKNGK